MFVTMGKRRRQHKRKTRQYGGFLPGLLGNLIGRSIARRKGRRVPKFNVGQYMKRSFGDRIKVAKVAAQRKIPTPGNTGIPTKRFLQSAFGF